MANTQNMYVKLIVHGRNARLRVCFDKVNSGLAYKIVSEQMGPNLYLHTTCGHTHKTPKTKEGGGGYGLKLKLN